MKVDVLTWTTKVTQLLQRRSELMRLSEELITHEQSDRVTAEIISINSVVLPALAKEIWDARNATKNPRDKKALKRLRAEVRNALDGIGVESEIDISSRAEGALIDQSKKAKTNSQRIKVNQALQRLRDTRRRYEALRRSPG